MIRKFVCSTLVSVLVGALLAVVPAAPVGADGNEAPGAPMVFRAVTARHHTCAVLDNGTLKCWGWDGYGQLGDGGANTNVGAPPVVPVDLGAGRTAIAVTAGYHHTCAVLDNGTVKCWGSDFYGQLGNGGTIPGTDLGAPPVNPVNLGAGRTATAVTAGYGHTCALLDNATVKCWGYDGYGQLGDGFGPMSLSAPPVNPVNLANMGPLRTATAVTAGEYHTCAVLDNGTLKCWGRDVHGQLGDGGTNTELGAPPVVPVDLGAGRTATAVTAGWSHTCAVLDNGTLKCWGDDGSGQLGDGGANTNLGAPPVNPVGLGAGRTATAVTAGYGHTCAVLDNGTVKCWGYDGSGQLGDGGANVNLGAPPVDPVDVGAGRTAAAVTVGDLHTCAVLDDFTLKCWGRDAQGQLGDGGGIPGTDLGAPPVVPVDLGAGRTVAGAIASLTVAKSADETTVVAGSVIHYHVTVTNTGNTALTGVAVSDAHAPACAGPLAGIAVGASRTVDCAYTTTSSDVGTYPNTATVDTDQTPAVTSNTVNVTVTALVAGVEGRVTETPSGDVVEGVWVVGVSTAGQMTAATMTDASGRYSLGLPVGTYKVEFVDPTGRHVGEWYENAPLGDFGAAEAVTVNGPTPVRVDAELPASGASGAIAGTVTETGESTPIGGVWVVAVRSYDGRIVAGVLSQPDGTFRVGGLTEGAYRLAVIDPTMAHAYDLFYDDKRDFATGDDIAVTAGAATVVNLDLDPARPAEPDATIEGAVTDAVSRDPVAGAWVAAVDKNTGVFTVATEADGHGRYSLKVPAGSYALEFIDPSGTHQGEWHHDTGLGEFGAATPVTVDLGATARVDEDLVPLTGAITGQVTDTTTHDGIAGAWVIAVRSSNGAMVAWDATDSDGRFAIAGLDPVNHRIAVIDPTGAHDIELFYRNHDDFGHGDDIAVDPNTAPPNLTIDLNPR